MAEVLIGELTEAEVEALKAKYPKGVYAIECNGHVGYFKNPNRMDLNAAMSKADIEYNLDMYETLGDLTFVGGSREILKDDDMFLGCIPHFKKKMDGAKSKLKNL